MRHSRAAILRGALVGGGFLLGAAVLTALIPNPFFDRYVPRSGGDVLFLVATAVLLGAYTTQRHTRIDCDRSGSAYLGGAGGYFAVSCPHCLPVVSGLLSTPVIAMSVVPLRPVAGVLSVGLLGGVVVSRRRRLVTEGPAIPDVDLRCPTCGMVLREGDRTPDPEFVGGSMRMDVDCPNCADQLRVFIGATEDDVLHVRKRVERREALSDGSNDGRTDADGYALEPVEETDDTT